MTTIYERAIEIFGKEPQMRKCQEECAETIVAINHNLLGRAPAATVLGELADVRIILEQMVVILDDTGGTLYQSILDEKLKHLNYIVTQQENIEEANR